MGIIITKFNIPIIVILMGSIVASGIQAMSPKESQKRPFFAGILKLGIAQNSFAPQLRKCVALLKNENYQKKVAVIRDMIFEKYKKGTLSSGVELAKVDSIAVKVVDPYTFIPKKQTLQKAPDLSFVLRIGVDAAAVGCDSENPEIYFSSSPGARIYINGSDESPKTRIILHELAHTLDGCLRKPQDERKACYAWLNEDVKDYPDSTITTTAETQEAMNEEGKQVSLVEWHADKQAAQWMAEMFPHKGEELRKAFKELKSREASLWFSRPTIYPPYSKLIEWHSNKDPLRMKEIKRLGLLWG